MSHWWICRPPTAQLKLNCTPYHVCHIIGGLSHKERIHKKEKSMHNNNTHCFHRLWKLGKHNFERFFYQSREQGRIYKIWRGVFEFCLYSNQILKRIFNFCLFMHNIFSLSYFWQEREKFFLFSAKVCESERSSKKGFHFLFEDPYAKNIMWWIESFPIMSLYVERKLWYIQRRKSSVRDTKVSHSVHCDI